MNLKLYIGHDEVAFDFETTEDRKTFWNNLAEKKTLHFKPQDAAEKVGTHTIRIHPSKMPFGYRWDFVA